jgi:hypothetical protein
MFAADWIISLFSSTMPITRINKFLGMFFKEGWIIVYKVVLLILERYITIINANIY